MHSYFIPVPDGAYRLGWPFYMPTKNGPVWAIALEDKYGLVLAAGVSVVLTFLFMRIWKLMCFLALSFPGSHTPRRYAALVTIWNSSDPLVAFRELALYSIYYLGHSWGDFAYGFTYCALAFVVFGSSITLGIIGPSLLQIGNVAPARPSALFYPAMPDPEDVIGLFQRLNLLAPENLRALGSVELARSSIRNRITFEPKWSSRNGSFDAFELSYSYHITGVDFGLQHGSNLRLNVKGSCRTEYNWIVSEHENMTNEDRYLMWNMEDQVEIVPIDEYSILNTPKALFWTHPDYLNQYKKDGNVSFAIVIASAHRASISPSSDPWYKTELRNLTIDNSDNVESFWVVRGRPALSCWEQDTWNYRGNSTTDVRTLKDMPGMKVKKVLLKLLAAVFANAPVLATIGLSTGDAALKPGIGTLFTREADFIDASDSHVQGDLERLIFASFIKSKNAFVDTMLFDYQGSAKNVMGHSVAEPHPGAGDFVVESARIQTFSMAGIITLLVALVALVVMELAMLIRLSHHRLKERNRRGEDVKDANVKPRPRALALFNVLSASQLFRRVRELHEGESCQGWTCTRQFPEPWSSTKGEEQMYIYKCPQEECKGHIHRHPSTHKSSILPSNTTSPPQVQ